MHRIDTEGNVAGQFSDGDPAVAQPATVVDGDWLNAVQGELANAVEDDGGPALVKGTNNQLITRLKAIFGRLEVANVWSALQTFTLAPRLQQGFQLGSGPSYPNGLNGAGSGKLTDVEFRNVTATTDITSQGFVRGAGVRCVGTGTTFAYSTARARSAYVDVPDFERDTNVQLSATATGAYLTNANTGGTQGRMVGRFYLPPGATLTGAWIHAANFSTTAALNLRLWLVRVTDNGTYLARTQFQQDTGGAGAGYQLGYAASTAAAWRGIPTASLPTLAAGEFVQIYVQFPADVNLAVSGAYVAYTHTELAPA